VIYQFEDFALDCERRELRRARAVIALEPQVFDLLEYLIRNRHRVVSKDDLFESVWDGRAVAEATLSSRLNGVRSAIGDSGKAQRLIRTLPHRGFRFVGVVEEQLADMPAGTGEKRPSATLTLPDKPSIAVMPFQSMSEEPEQHHLAEGLAEDIITGLSRLKWLFVIARSSTVIYRNRGVDVRQIGRELGVRYLVDGSVRKAGGRVRITARLVEAGSGSQLWADRYDRDLVDILTVQDEITESILATIEPRLYAAESIRARQQHPGNLDAWSYFAQAVTLLDNPTRENLAAMRGFLRNATQLEPTYARAHALLAFVIAAESVFGWSDPEPAIGAAWASATSAVRLDGDEPWGHLALGYVHRQRGETDLAIAEYLKALDLNASFAFAHAHLGFALCGAGRTAEALAHADASERLSPYGLVAGINDMVRAMAAFIDARYGDGVDFARRAIRQGREDVNVRRHLVANLAAAGRLAEARPALVELRRSVPNLSVNALEFMTCFWRKNDSKRYVDAFRAAGLE
jgi:TolB-like protein/Tfp pilus assembly protein PilF